MVHKHIQKCTCMNSLGSFSDSNFLGSWLVCSDCKKLINDSFEFFHECDEENQQELAGALMN